MGIIKYHIKKLKIFDEITKYRLILLGLITIAVEMILPVLSQYYYLLKINTIEAASIIALFSILKKIGQKLVKYIMNNFSFSKIFLIIIIFDFLWTIGTSFYFINKNIMIWLDLIIGTIQLPFIIAFSMNLNNYIMFFYKNSYVNFQNYKNDVLAESALLGLILSFSLSLISLKLIIILFLIIMSCVFIFQINIYNKFKKYDFKYMYNYKKFQKVKNVK